MEQLAHRWSQAQPHLLTGLGGPGCLLRPQRQRGLWVGLEASVGMNCVSSKPNAASTFYEVPGSPCGSPAPPTAHAPAFPSQ